MCMYIIFYQSLLLLLAAQLELLGPVDFIQALEFDSERLLADLQGLPSNFKIHAKGRLLINPNF